MSQSLPAVPVPELLKLFDRQNHEHALIILDSEGRVVAWLAASEHIFGYSAQEMVGQSLERLFTPEDRALGLFSHELNVARGNGHASDDRWKVRQNGSRVWVYGLLTAIRNESGEIVGFGKVLRDRTDVRAQIETLENRVEALRKQAERRTEFLGTVAHELRNPLAPIANAVAVLKALQLPQLEKVADMVGRQLSQLQRLVDDLMDAVRVDTGKIRLTISATNLQEVLNGAADACRGAAEGRKLTFKSILPDVPIVMEADPVRLGQVFANLFHNAVKYTPPDGHIWVKATVEGNEAVVRVQDSGIGIAPEMLPKIFEMFTQEASSLDRSEGGLGIGLALVKDIVSRHGGTVQVRSEGKGKGSEFSVRLPLVYNSSSVTAG